MNIRLKSRVISLMVFLVLSAGFESNAFSQNYPNKLIHVIVPLIAGGAGDLAARAVTDKLIENLHNPIVIDNRPGGGSVIGLDVVAKSIPDGYTLGLASDSGLAISVHLMKKVPYDPIKDFAPITLVCEMASALIVHPSFPANSVEELIALAKSKPGKLHYASAGTGLASQLGVKVFKKVAGVDIVHVPYKGSIPAVTSILNKESDLMFGLLSTTGPQINSGRLKALAVTSAKRSSLFPNLRTVSESGVEGFECVSRFGFVAPAGTPEKIITKLNTEIVKILSTQSSRERYLKLGAEIAITTPEEYAAIIKRENIQWKKVIEETGMAVN